MITTFNLKSKLFHFSSFCRIFSFCGKMSGNSPQSISLNAEYINKIKEFIPELNGSLHKGQCGRIGILGGSQEYTGATYFAAISTLKVGADLVYVFCCKESASAIKSYSPELIVNPILDSKNVVHKIEPWLQRLHTLVIGPGLGRDPGLLKNVEQIIKYCNMQSHPPLPLVIDADGLFLITQNIGLIQNYKGPVVLTPNTIEFERLSKQLSATDVLQVALALNAIIVKKGQSDLIINGIQNKVLSLDSNYISLVCDTEGSNRRCGGQGDILSGCIATFVAWFRLSRSIKFESDFLESNYPNENNLNVFNEKFLGYSLAAFAACMVTKTCSKLAYNDFERSMTASDMISYIHKAFKMYFN